MPKVKSVFVCRSCGFECPKWNGRCPNCGEWNTLEEVEAVPVKSSSSARASARRAEKILSLKEVDLSETSEVRYKTGLNELDRVLGGGLVKGSLVLLGGEPGIGKSTLLLQICEFLGQEHTILYVSGEESARQIRLRAERLGVSGAGLYILAESDAHAISEAVQSNKPDIVIIDSIQTMSVGEINSTPGSITQVRECTNLFMRLAKSEEIPFFIVGHVNKDGAIAGPKVMEHIVDAVLYFEGDRNLSYRILRAAKNRFGSTNEIGVFDMRDNGLEQVENPSQMLLSERPKDGVSGCCVVCTMEGTRPILAEVQALVAKSSSNAPRRVATGFDFNRLWMVLAVLEKRLGFYYGALDVYINIIGGLRITEPAADLPVAMALYSSLTDKKISNNIIAFGEIGLGGEIRSVSHLEQRIAEARRLGFTKCIVPRHSLKNMRKFEDIEVVGVSYLNQAFAHISDKNSEA